MTRSRPSGARRKELSMIVTVSVPKAMSMYDARREARYLINTGVGWSTHPGEALKVRATEPLGNRGTAPVRPDAAAGDLLEATRIALATIENTLRARGYRDGECTDEWAEEVRTEVATRAKLRAAIAKAEGVQA